MTKTPRACIMGISFAFAANLVSAALPPNIGTYLREQSERVETPPATGWVEIVQVPASEATLTGLPAGAAISLRVLSANPAGYAQPSEPVTAIVP